LHPFEVSFDSKARAAYLRFSLEKVAKTFEQTEGALVLDFDHQSNLVGMEVLSPGTLRDLFHPKERTPQFPGLPHLDDREISNIERLFEIA
jgi:uncharacterized protein YuzE